MGKVAALTDQKLHELSASRQSDLDKVKTTVAELEARLNVAKMTHSTCAKNNHDAKLAREAIEANAHLPKNRMFEVRDEHGRLIRHRAHDADHLRLELTPGYVITAECFGYKADGSGGISASIDSSVPSIMAG